LTRRPLIPFSRIPSAQCLLRSKKGRDQARESRNSVLKLPVWLASVLQYPSWRVLARESSDCRGKQHGCLLAAGSRAIAPRQSTRSSVAPDDTNWISGPICETCWITWPKRTSISTLYCPIVGNNPIPSTYTSSAFANARLKPPHAKNVGDDSGLSTVPKAADAVQFLSVAPVWIARLPPNGNRVF
jgi:hypothetical protein